MDKPGTITIIKTMKKKTATTKMVNKITVRSEGESPKGKSSTELGVIDMEPSTEAMVTNICNALINGSTYREIAEGLGCPLSTLHDFTSKPEHSARVRAALDYSADSYNDMAIQVIKDAKANLIEMTRARELAQHYRWLAGKRSPKRYGDKMEIDHTLNDKRKEIGGLFTPLIEGETEG